MGNFEIGNKLPLALIAGPCQIQSRQHAVELAGKLVELTSKLGINYIFASFDKANRTSITGARGVGIEEGIRTFDEIKKLYGCPIVTDIHEREQCQIIAPHVDMLQIPAFLCRQTDLVVAAAKTGKVVNIKKGQFLAPWDMKNIVKKSVDSGNANVCITERGTSFGYNTLVTDIAACRNGQRYRLSGYFRCHALGSAAGRRAEVPAGRGEFAPVLAQAAVAVGVAAVFIETHEDPAKSPSDGPNMIPLHAMEKVVSDLMAYDCLTKSRIQDY
ncbi:MAG: 3-deoxy-8-phosphooctulonate synthase [Alphaproteobacteria bacterium]